VSRSSEKLITNQIAGIVALSAVALGIQVVRHLNRTPAQKAAEAERLRRHHARKREYEVRRKQAWEADRAHWRAFEADAQAQALFEAEYYLPVDFAAVPAVVEKTRSGSMWAITETHRASHRDDVVTLSHYLDGGFLTAQLESPIGEFTCSVGAPAGRLTIGECDGTPSELQRKMAGLIAAIQAQGPFSGRRICAVLPNRRAVLERHYAAFARARGWPPEPDGEADRVQRAYYASADS
jgi:hypothetical protein